MKVLHVLPSIDPKSGGPMEGVRQLGSRMIELGHSWEVVTLDDPVQSFIREFPFKVWPLGPSYGTYKYNPKLVPWLKQNAQRYEAVIVNGIWQYHSFAAWRALSGGPVPYYVFTHGMLDPWFKRTFPLKHAKKWLYWPWADYRVLRDARAVLFTTEEERLLAGKSFWLYRANGRVVSYGTRQPPTDRAQLRERFLSSHPSLRGQRPLLFLGRIHEKKGCDLLIQAFAKVASTNAALRLVMAGPDQMGWSSELKTLSQDLNVSDRIIWPGMLVGDLKWGAYYSAEAFVLPSHQENFGIAVAEALGCGLPVLVSDKVNIWREIESDQSGFVEKDSLEGTIRNIRSWLELNPEERAAMCDRAVNTFRSRFTIDAMATSIVDLLTPSASWPQDRITDQCAPSG